MRHCLELTERDLADATMRLSYQPGNHAPGETFNMALWERPVIGRTYVIGCDFAYGIAGRDWDAAWVLDRTSMGEGDGTVKAVCRVMGRLGERFERILYPLACWYGGAFIVGERQVGLPTLRRLWDVYGYRHLYYDRAEDRRNRKRRDTLGHHRSAGDPLMSRLKTMVRERRLDVRCAQTIEQMGRLVYVDRTTDANAGLKSSDEQLGMKLMGGGSPDLVMALMYAVHGLFEVDHFHETAPKVTAGSYADIFGAAPGLPDDERPEGGIVMPGTVAGAAPWWE